MANPTVREPTVREPTAPEPQRQAATQRTRAAPGVPDAAPATAVHVPPAPEAR
jgi:hypothetical protein